MRSWTERPASKLTKLSLAESAEAADLFVRSAWTELLRADAQEALASDDYREAFLALMEAHRLLVLLTLSAAGEVDGDS